jgi:osmotically-inducible protein OsmY
MSANPDLDSSGISMRMLGPVMLLEGYINSYADRERAISIAALFVGPENVQDRMLGRVIDH